jgi:hypothetical protein
LLPGTVDLHCGYIGEKINKIPVLNDTSVKTTKKTNVIKSCVELGMMQMTYVVETERGRDSAFGHCG